MSVVSTCQGGSQDPRNWSVAGRPWLTMTCRKSGDILVVVILVGADKTRVIAWESSGISEPVLRLVKDSTVAVGSTPVLVSCG